MCCNKECLLCKTPKLSLRELLKYQLTVTLGLEKAWSDMASCPSAMRPVPVSEIWECRKLTKGTGLDQTCYKVTKINSKWLWSTHSLDSFNHIKWVTLTSQISAFDVGQSHVLIKGCMGFFYSWFKI